jgi:hypothetical protein
MAPPAVNTVFSDPDFGSSIVRVTDETTNPRQLGSFLRNPATGRANPWSMDAKKLYVIGEGGWELAFGFDPITMKVSSLPGRAVGQALVLPLRPGSSFSFVDADLIYGTTSVNPLTISSYRFSTGTTATVIDTTTCDTQPPLISSRSVVSDDDVSLSADDSRVSISEGGAQFGSHMFVVVYDKKLGCRWFNTQTGQIGGQWGATGSASIASSFLIRHAWLSGNGAYVQIQQNNFGFYVWDLATLTVTPCPAVGSIECGGYGTVGNSHYVNGAGKIDQMNILERSLGNLGQTTQLVLPLPQPYHFGQVKLFAWNNGIGNDNLPVCTSTYNYEGDTSIEAPFENEILCLETDGAASTVWRFAHNRAVWISPFFNTQPLGNVSPDGRFFMFTSGWDNQLGSDQYGNPRSDVWIVRLD